MIEAPAAVVAGVDPVRADDHDHHVGTGDLLGDDTDEVGAERDARRVEEHAVGAELTRECVGEPTGTAFRVAAPVADEEARAGVRHCARLAVPWRERNRRRTRLHPYDYSTMLE